MLNRSKPHLHSLALLLITTLIWGSTFPLMKSTIASLSPAMLMGARFLIATVAFLPFCRSLNLGLVRDGSLLGLIAFVAYLTQVIGLETASASRAAVITSLHVVIVPLLGWLFGQQIRSLTFVAARMAVFGVGVMSWQAGVVTWGDVWTCGYALSYAIYILLMEPIAQRHSALKLTAVQLITVTVLSILWAAPSWAEQIEIVKSHWLAIVYLGVAATAFTTWTQAVAQRYLAATEAAIIYTLEPVFAVMFSFWWLGEGLTLRGAIGAGIILLAMLLCQVQTYFNRSEASLN